MSPRVVDWTAAVAAVRALADQSAGRTTYVGIDGRGGAGKSSLADDIAAATPTAIVVRVDDFSGPRVPQWDWDRLRRQVVRPLAEGRAARYQRWDWDRDEGAEWHDVPVGRLVVIEGVSATRDEVDAPWALRIWVEAARETRLARALARDGPDLMARWLDDWMPSEEAYIAAQRPDERADLVVSGEPG